MKYHINILNSPLINMLQMSTIIARLWDLMVKLGFIQEPRDFPSTCLGLIKTTDDPYYDEENKDGYSGPIWF